MRNFKTLTLPRNCFFRYNFLSLCNCLHWRIWSLWYSWNLLKVALKTKNQSINQLNRSGLWQLDLRSVRGVQHYVIKFASDLRQVGDFFSAPPVTSTNVNPTAIGHCDSIDWLIDFWFLTPLSVNFSYIIVTSFSGGRSRSTRREPPTMGKQLVNFIQKL
jgi:hypothetical protein